jgi:mannose-1-phosphate guanylyltransferase
MVNVKLKVLILAGGLATRLRPLSCTRPKILFPIVNRPLLQWTFERLARNGFKEAILAVNHQTEIFIRQSKVAKYGMKITYSRDPFKKPLGTGGPVKKAEKLIGGDDPFLVVNGDIFADVNYTDILKIHEEKGSVATIALRRVEDPSRYGVAELTKENRITRFIEKPTKETAPTNMINAGVYVLNTEIFKYIPEKRKVSMEREVFPKLVEEGKLYGYVSEGLWTDIGEPEDYIEVNKNLLDLLGNQQKYKVTGKTEVKKPVAFDKGISIGEKSIIGPYAVLGRNAIIGSHVRIRNSIVFPRIVISDSALIKGAIIGEDVFIGKGVKIREGCVLGDCVRINDNVSLAKGVSVCPTKEVSQDVLTSKCVM